MSTNPHPTAQLSAYLDDALGSTERAGVSAHLEACAQCRARLTELRSTAALIGALSGPVPSRRLVPRLAGAPAWLAPLRTLTTLASGVSVFLFIASALLANVNTLATTTSGSGNAAAAPARADATSPRSDAAVPALGQASASAAEQAKAAGPPTASPAPSSERFSTPSAPQDAAGALADRGAQRELGGPAAPPIASPWLWLSLAVILGAIAIALQRRLRSA